MSFFSPFRWPKSPFHKTSAMKIPEKEKIHLSGPFFSFSDFEVGDIVTVKEGVIPGGRYRQPIEAIGEMMIHGKMQLAIKVRGMPYYSDELILVEKKKNKLSTGNIAGLWH